MLTSFVSKAANKFYFYNLNDIFKNNKSNLTYK